MADKFSKKTYAVAKSYVKKTADALGAVKGAPAVVKSVEDATGGKNITYEWTGTSGAKQTQTVFFPNGADGVSVTDARIDNGDLMITLSDSTEINAGTLPSLSTEDKAKLDGLADIKSVGTGLSLDPATGELTATGQAVASVEWSGIQNIPTDLVYDPDYKHFDGKILYEVSDFPTGTDIDPDALYLKDGKIYQYDETNAEWVVATSGDDGTEYEFAINSNSFDVTDTETGVTQSLTLPSGGGSSELSADMTTTKAVGGVEVGKAYAAGTDLEQIIRDVLSPVLYPSFTAPSATLSATGAKLLEVGTTLNTTMTVAFNQGSISPAYGTSGKRSGAATGYILNGGTEQTTNTFNVVVDENTTSYTAVVKYAEGEQPKDSAGQNYQTPLAAGQVSTNTINYEFVPAIWDNTSNIATMAKAALVSRSAKQKVFNFPAQSAPNWECFSIPAAWTVTAIEVLNTLSNQYEDCSSEFTVTDETRGTVNYKTYTYDTGISTGARTIRVKWN